MQLRKKFFWKKKIGENRGNEQEGGWGEERKGWDLPRGETGVERGGVGGLVFLYLPHLWKSGQIGDVTGVRSLVTSQRTTLGGWTHWSYGSDTTSPLYFSVSPREFLPPPSPPRSPAPRCLLLLRRGSPHLLPKVKVYCQHRILSKRCKTY